MKITEKTTDAIKTLKRAGFKTEEIAEMLGIENEQVTMLAESEVARSLRKFAENRRTMFSPQTISQTCNTIEKHLKVRTEEELKEKTLAFCAQDQKVYLVEEDSGVLNLRSIRNTGKACSTLLWFFYSFLRKGGTGKSLNIVAED